MEKAASLDAEDLFFSLDSQKCLFFSNISHSLLKINTIVDINVQKTIFKLNNTYKYLQRIRCLCSIFNPTFCAGHSQGVFLIGCPNSIPSVSNWKCCENLIINYLDKAVLKQLYAIRLATFPTCTCAATKLMCLAFLRTEAFITWHSKSSQSQHT